MGNVAEGLGQFPGREGIGRKTGVNEAECGDNAFVGQVRKVVPYLAAGELTFINDCFIREGSHVKSDGILFYRVVDGVAGVVA